MGKNSVDCILRKLLRSDTFKCCRGCTDRRPGCHSRCDKYKEARKKLDELNARMRKEKLTIAEGVNTHKQRGGFS